ncbi:MAG: Multidrug export protein MepA [Alphaproteobacteria bacterium ADurb.Bin438]|nr:MAG: Multidrug export protein MepA [Alphaproteobacteria bacterium ADurb.Bin438]
MSSVELTHMGSQKIPKLLMQFAIPIVIGMLANAMYNLVDRAFIGNFINKQALTAATVYHPYFMLTIAFSCMVGSGSTAYVSSSFGSKDYPLAQRIFTNAITLVLVFMLPLTLVGMLFAPTILKASGASHEILPLALEYFYVMALGAPFGGLAFVLSCLIRSENHPKCALKVTLVGACLNVVLDALFIIVFKMGIFGAGLATAISQVVSLIYAISFYYRKESVLKLKGVHLIPEKMIAKKVISIGISSSIVILSFGLFSLLMNKTLYQYGGDDAIAVMGILMTLDSLLFLPIIGICDGAQPIFGYNYGAKNFKRIYETLKFGTLITFLYACISFVIVFTLSKYLIAIFTNSEEIIKEGAKALRFSYSAVFFAGFGIIMSSLFQALQRVKYCIFLGLARTLLIFIPLIYILPPLMGLNGAWLCLPAIDFSGSLFGAIFFYFERKRLNKEEEALSLLQSES